MSIFLQKRAIGIRARAKQRLGRRLSQSERINLAWLKKLERREPQLRETIKRLEEDRYRRLKFAGSVVGGRTVEGKRITLPKNTLTKFQLKKARSLTEKAQIKEFGRVVVKQRDVIVSRFVEREGKRVVLARDEEARKGEKVIEARTVVSKGVAEKLRLVDEEKIAQATEEERIRKRVEEIKAKPPVEITPREIIEEPTPPREVIEVEPEKLTKLREAIEAQKERQRKFQESEGFKRIDTLASIITGGEGRPSAERGMVGGTIQEVVSGFMSFPLALGGGLALSAEKIALTARALTIEETRKRVGQELFIENPKRLVQAFKDMTPQEKAGTAIFILLAPLLGGGKVRQLSQRKAVRQEQLAKLTPTERQKALDFEARAKELTSAQPEVGKIRLGEVERLKGKSPEILDKYISENKGDIVVGGSVAQRTQIRGFSRKPEDIDLFTTRNTKEVVNEIVKVLEEGGVGRVSSVKGKQITIEGAKAIEVKDLGLLKANIKRVQLPFLPASLGIVTTPRGIKVLSLSTQAKRKIIGGFGLEAQRIRIKDIQDLPNILRALARSKKGSVVVSQTTEPAIIIPALILPSLPSVEALKKKVPLRVLPPSPVRPPIREEPSPILKIPAKEPSFFKPTPVSILQPTPTEPSIITPTRLPPPTPPSIITPTPEPPPTPTRLPPAKAKRKSEFKGKVVDVQRQPAYDLLLKKKLKLVKGRRVSQGFNKVASGLTKSSAVGLGNLLVDTFTNRSYTIVKKGTTNKQNQRLASFDESLSHKIRVSKRNKNIFVEKIAFAIDSRQEKEGIPYKAHRLRRLGLLKTKKRKTRKRRTNRLAGASQFF